MGTGCPTLDILICTIDSGIERTANVLLPEQEPVRYIISAQYSGPEPPLIPQELASRTDVTVNFIKGHGLSANRNNALSMSTADICLIADDDNRYLPQHIGNIIESWQQNPDADILVFQAETLEGQPLHPYPAPYVCSVEITFRRESVLKHGIKFDERFGLGSPRLCAGEEDVFMADARRAGLTIRYVPKAIVRTPGSTTSATFIGNKKLQITKGATFRYIYGTGNAVWRSFKEAGWYLLHKGANPFPILHNMLKGIWILR